MNPSEWTDPRVPKVFFKAPPAPSALETEAFVSRVMSRIEEGRSPWLAWLSQGWTAPALGLGIAALFLSIFYSAPVEALVLDVSVTGADFPAAWVIALDEEP